VRATDGNLAPVDSLTDALVSWRQTIETSIPWWSNGPRLRRNGQFTALDRTKSCASRGRRRRASNPRQMGVKKNARQNAGAVSRTHTSGGLTFGVEL